MDSLITAAARALAAGDPFDALNRIALRQDPPALALRGIAMAQMGDLARARELVRKAARAFGAHEPVARARCIVAEHEIAFASRDLAWPAKALDAPIVTLEAHGDLANAAHGRYLEARRLLLLGRLDEAERALAAIDASVLPAAGRAGYQLAMAGIAMRRLHAKAAHEAIVRAEQAAREARIPALTAEIESASALLDSPVARAMTRGKERLIKLDEMEAMLASDALLIDACRYAVRQGKGVIPLARRPVLLTLARVLAEAWPGDVSRDALVMRAFRAKHADESHRARLRVEMGRLRAVLKQVAAVNATKHGFALVPAHAREVVVLARPLEERHPAVLAFLSDGEAWSSSALALALGASQRNVQRALDELAAAGKVQAVGQGRSRRWTMPPLPGFATILLLPPALAG